MRLAFLSIFLALPLAGCATNPTPAPVIIQPAPSLSKIKMSAQEADAALARAQRLLGFSKD